MNEESRRPPRQDWHKLGQEPEDSGGDAKRLGQERVQPIDTRWLPLLLLERLRNETYLMNYLAEYNDTVSRIGIAKHPNTSLVVLQVMAKDPIWEVRAEVARNKNTDPRTLCALSRDPDFLIRGIVSQNPNLDLTDLVVLLKDEHVDTRRVAKEAMKNRDVLDELLD